MKTIRLAILAISMVMLTACTSLSPNRYDDSEGMQTSTTYNAVVVHVRAVTTQSTSTGGEAYGLVLGALAFSHFGAGTGRAAYALLGGTATSAAGGSIERAGSRDAGLEIVVCVTTRNGNELVTVVQGADLEVHAGENVFLIASQSHNILSGTETRYRVVPAR